MPYSKKEKKLYQSLVRQYGKEKAERIYHGMLMSGKYDKIFSARSKKKRDRRKTKKRGRKKQRRKKRGGKK